VQARRWFGLGVGWSANSRSCANAAIRSGTLTPRASSGPPDPLGAIVGSRQALDIVSTWSHAEFDRVWVMTMAGHLKFARLYFTRPHYNGGLVVSASFSTEPEG